MNNWNLERNTWYDSANEEDVIHIMQVKLMIQMRILLLKEKKTKREEFIKREKNQLHKYGGI